MAKKGLNRVKQGKNTPLKEERQMNNILKLLDEKIEGYYQIKKDYPKNIIMNQEIKEKIFKELELAPKLDNCWIDKKDNYRGISIKIKEGTFIELK